MAMHDLSLVISTGFGFVKFDKIFSAHSSYMLHAGVVSRANSRRVIGGVGFQGWVHAKNFKFLAHLFSTTLGTTGALGAGGALLGAATGALLGAGVLGCGLKFSN